MDFGISTMFASTLTNGSISLVAIATFMFVCAYIFRCFSPYYTAIFERLWSGLLTTSLIFDYFLLGTHLCCSVCTFAFLNILLFGLNFLGLQVLQSIDRGFTTGDWYALTTEGDSPFVTVAVLMALIVCKTVITPFTELAFKKMD